MREQDHFPGQDPTLPNGTSRKDVDDYDPPPNQKESEGEIE
jgi:hypothetical protein